MTRRRRVWMWIAACVLVHTASASAPVVIAHRGASGYLPEHTLAAYALAYGQHAAWIEPDLVMTRDGVLVAVHDVTLDATTDVGQRFAARKRADGHYYAIDFTFDEVSTLRVNERLPGRFPRTAALFTVPRFDDVLALLAGLNASTGCSVGVIPEIKSSAFHHAAGLDPERAVLDALARFGLTSGDSNVRIQSFEPASLLRLRDLGSAHHLVQLIADDPEQPTPVDLGAIARQAQTVAPAKTLLRRDPGLIERAHALRLGVTTWTFRADHVGEGFDSFGAELDWAARIGVDALFTDHPDRAIAHYGTPPRC